MELRTRAPRQKEAGTVLLLPLSGERCPVKPCTVAVDVEEQERCFLFVHRGKRPCGFVACGLSALENACVSVLNLIVLHPPRCLYPGRSMSEERKPCCNPSCAGPLQRSLLQQLPFCCAQAQLLGVERNRGFSGCGVRDRGDLKAESCGLAFPGYELPSPALKSAEKPESHAFL